MTDKNKRYFKVKYGFDVLSLVSIEEGGQLEKAIYSQKTGTPAQIGNSYINGKNIISISPHWHKHTGWIDTYEPKDLDDMKKIERDCPSYEGIMEYYKERVDYLMGHNRTNEIGNMSEIPLQDLRTYIDSKTSQFTKSLADKMRIN